MRIGCKLAVLQSVAMSVAVGLVSVASAQQTLTISSKANSLFQKRLYNDAVKVLLEEVQGKTETVLGGLASKSREAFQSEFDSLVESLRRTP